jgi:hypothetical protein
MMLPCPELGMMSPWDIAPTDPVFNGTNDVARTGLTPSNASKIPEASKASIVSQSVSKS